VIEDASHWIPLDAPDRFNQLLLGWLRGPDTVG
jgi:pimeloyl-ACP methyl ester carboxylesterase